MTIKFKSGEIALSYIVLFFAFLYSFIPKTTTSVILYYLPYLLSAVMVLVMFVSHPAKISILSTYWIWRTVFITWAIVSYFLIAVSKDEALFFLKRIVLDTIIIWQAYLTAKRDSILGVLKAFYFSVVCTLLYIFVISDISKIFLFRLGVDVVGENWNSNSIGIMAGFGFLVMEIIRKNNCGSRKLSVVFQVLCIFVVLLSGSRTALLVFAVGSVGFFIVSSSNTLKFLRNVILITVVIMLGYWALMNIPFLYNIIGVRVKHVIDYISNGSVESGSIRWRSIMLDEGIMFFKSNPIIGYGLNNFRVLFGNLNPTYITYAHNNYVELLVDGGIIGTVIYYALHIFILLRYKKSTSSLKKPALVLLVVTLLADYCMVSYTSFVMQFIIFIIAYFFDMTNDSNTGFLGSNNRYSFNITV